jgi:hypothetical protein
VAGRGGGGGGGGCSPPSACTQVCTKGELGQASSGCTALTACGRAGVLEPGGEMWVVRHSTQHTSGAQHSTPCSNRGDVFLFCSGQPLYAPPPLLLLAYCMVL